MTKADDPSKDQSSTEARMDSTALNSGRSLTDIELERLGGLIDLVSTFLAKQAIKEWEEQVDKLCSPEVGDTPSAAEPENPRIIADRSVSKRQVRKSRRNYPRVRRKEMELVQAVAHLGLAEEQLGPFIDWISGLIANGAWKEHLARLEAESTETEDAQKH